jgi:hypothetical protein
MTLGLASVAMAGQNANAAISLHTTKPTTKAAKCEAFSYSDAAGDPWTVPFNTRAKPCPAHVGDFDVWILVCNGSDSLGVAGAEYGIEYDGADGSGVDVNSWLACGDLEFTSTDYPASGGGNVVTWVAPENCQVTNRIFQGSELNDSVIAVVGVLNVTAYGQDELRVTPRPVTGRLKVADCLAREDDLTDAAVSRKGVVNFCGGGRKGYNFCKNPGILSMEETTWGKLKTQYEN